MRFPASAAGNHDGRIALFAGIIFEDIAAHEKEIGILTQGIDTAKNRSLLPGTAYRTKSSLDVFINEQLFKRKKIVNIHFVGH